MKTLILQILKASFDLEIANTTIQGEDYLLIELKDGKKAQIKIS